LFSFYKIAETDFELESVSDDEEEEFDYLDELERASVSGFEEATTAENEEGTMPGTAATGKPTLREVSYRLNVFVFRFSCFILNLFSKFSFKSVLNTFVMELPELSKQPEKESKELWVPRRSSLSVPPNTLLVYKHSLELMSTRK
jgi:hypothetical protein